MCSSLSRHGANGIGLSRGAAPGHIVLLLGQYSAHNRAMDRRGPLSPAAMLTFAAVARAGGIRHAEAELDSTRSTISRHLAELEAALGGRLIARTTRRFAL